MSVFNRIIMDIIAKNFKFPFIPNRMFPESSLPKAPFPSALSRCAHGPFGPAVSQITSRELQLNHLPAKRKIRIAFRQRPQTMEMIRQQNHRFLLKRIFRPGFRDGLMKGTPCRIIGQKRSPPMADHRKEKRPAGLKRTNIIGHDFMIKITSNHIQQKI